jgi:hypothetical protein
MIDGAIVEHCWAGMLRRLFDALHVSAAGATYRRRSLTPCNSLLQAGAPHCAAEETPPGSRSSSRSGRLSSLNDGYITTT